MLSADDNVTLTRVGRGTPTGELRRRYGQPIAAVAQLDDRPARAVRLHPVVLSLHGGAGDER